MPLQEHPESSVFVRRFNVGRQDWKWSVSGERIKLIPEVSEQLHDNDFTLSIKVDFDFVRELRVRELGKLGATEKSVYSEPKLERYRTMMLHPKNLDDDHAYIMKDSPENIVTLDGPPHEQ